MGMLNETRVVFRQFEMDAAVREHAELWDAWKVVESKAQPVSTTAGVFLAGVFAYASAASSSAGVPEKFLLIILAVLLLFSIVQALRSIWIVEVASPHLGLGAKNEIDRILQVSQPPNNLDGRYENLLADTAQRWMQTSDKIRVSLQKKTKLLTSSLRFLAWAAVVTMCLVVTSLFCR